MNTAPRRLALALFALTSGLVFYYLAQHELLLVLALLLQLPPLWAAVRGRTLGVYLLLVTSAPLVPLALETGAPALLIPALAPTAGGLALFALLAPRLWRFDRAAASITVVLALLLGSGLAFGTLVGFRSLRDLNERYWNWIGELDARSDAAHGRYKLLSFGCALGSCACGLPASEEALLKHGIRVVCVTPTCYLPRKQSEIWLGYSLEMQRLIELQRGAGFFKRLGR